MCLLLTEDFAAMDDSLISALALELTRNGGAVRASELLLFDRSLRRQLGDRRLVKFLAAHPKTFALSGTSGDTIVRLLPGCLPSSQPR